MISSDSNHLLAGGCARAFALKLMIFCEQRTASTRLGLQTTLAASPALAHKQKELLKRVFGKIYVISLHYALVLHAASSILRKILGPTILSLAYTQK